MIRFCIVVLLVSALQIFAIGLQHGVFRSQSTQGPTWTGTAPIVSEHYDIKVNPTYLDVELTLEFGVGGTAPADFRNALEIVGNLNLEKGSTVVGMLVWYKGKILKGKLKTKDFARRQYEEVVQRNSEVPPPPRDPVLLEWIREDNYDISIFPVEWGGTRKLRLRYFVPADGARIGYPHAFSNNATVTMEMGSGIRSFRLLSSSVNIIEYHMDAIQSKLQLSSSTHSLMAYGGNSLMRHPLTIIPDAIDTSLGSQIFLGRFEQQHFAGNMAQVFYRAPKDLYQDSSEWNSEVYQAYAKIRSASDSCSKLVRENTNVLRIFSRDPIKPEIEWSLFKGDSLVRKLEEKTKVYQEEDGLSFARSFGNTSFYPMSTTMPASLGINLGFLDTKYTLVALEEDTIGKDQENQFTNSGVPTLLQEDLFPAVDEVYEVPVDQWLKNRNTTKETLLRTVSYNSPFLGIPVLQKWPKALRIFVQHGILHLCLDGKGEQLGHHLVVEVLTMKGEILKRWTKNALESNEITWSPMESAQGSGAFLIRLRMDEKTLTKTFVIP
jgi:Vault protein inter-alpha-trypsin domain